MNPDEIVASLARHGLVFDSPITTKQILSHLKGTKDGSEIAHLLAELARQVAVRRICGDGPITTKAPYP